MTNPWTAYVLTLYPEMFPGPLGLSLAGKALQDNRWALETRNIREFGSGRHKSVDDTPAGGGPGMVLRADVVASAIDKTRSAAPDCPMIYLTPRGKPLTQSVVHRLSDGPGVVLLCGRFEGIDERVLEARDIEEISIGDYVLSGGELAAMALIDAVVRLQPGVIGSDGSTAEESFEQGLLEYPHYTRPNVWEDRQIPDVLISGDHARIAEWRRSEAERLTRKRRPDLWEKYKKG